MSKQAFFVNEDELDDYQVQLLQKRINRSMVVSGCAGSGKSILALWKAKQIQELEDGSTYKFIVFTKALNQYMSDGMRTVGLDASNFTYHWWWTEKESYASADYIIVDEIQDFTREEINKFKEAAKRAFFFWGDSSQSIYRGLKNTQDVSSVAYEAGIQPEKLVFNHRLPKKIAQLAGKLINDEELVDRCRKEGAEMPRILHFNTLDEQLDMAMEQIKNRQITDAAIMFPTNEMTQQAFEYLTKKGYTIEAKYKDKGDYHNSRMDLDFSSDNPKLMTYHSAKGLQFEAVFLPECTTSKENDLAPLYVAITRSYQYLFIMYSVELSRFFDAVPKNCYLTALESDDNPLSGFEDDIPF